AAALVVPAAVAAALAGPAAVAVALAGRGAGSVRVSTGEGLVLSHEKWVHQADWRVRVNTDVVVTKGIGIGLGGLHSRCGGEAACCGSSQGICY
uniref:Uncharacterized protein n=1 Tax=Chenopodium quinoa TaxID=63459 RepID=A0A803MR41_CHEQI